MSWELQGLKKIKDKLVHTHSTSYLTPYEQSVCTAYKIPNINFDVCLVYGCSGYEFFRGWVEATSGDEAMNRLGVLNDLPVQEGKYAGIAMFNTKNITSLRVLNEKAYFSCRGELPKKVKELNLFIKGDL